MRLAIMALALVGCSANRSDDRASAGNDTGAPTRAREQLAASQALLAAPGVVSALIGGVARLNGRDIRPISIVENSLCPVDVDCVWAGRLRLKVSISGVPGEPVLELGQAFALPGGGMVTLVAIAPPRFHAPPPGLEVNRPPRFGFRSG